MTWFLMALLSAFFAGITTILAKCGIRHTNPNLATAVRTLFILIFSIIIVLLSGAFRDIQNINIKSLMYLILSGIVTGISWILYFKALSIGDVNKVVAVDKSSVVFSILLAMILFNETNNLFYKIISISFIFFGTILMIDRKGSCNNDRTNKKWIVYALLSSVFASLTSILGKFGVSNIDSNLGTAIRTLVILFISWMIVFFTKEYREIKFINKREFAFILFSGISTGISWLCYYYAIKYGIVSLVIPIDKLSILVSIGFSYIVFKEKLSRRSFIGLIMLIIGTILIAIFA